ncbi:hypothetical protein PMAYCL1PPCAC_05297, partial [Pristionchus mayeri]
VLHTFISLSMISSFVSMIIARHQLLISDGSTLKMMTSLRRGVYIFVGCLMHFWTILDAFGVEADINMLLEILNCVSRQLRWHDRRLNWFILRNYPPSIVSLTTYGAYVFIIIGAVFILLPLVHILIIIMQTRKKAKSIAGYRRAHLSSAKTIIIQFFVLIAFLCLPFFSIFRSLSRREVYASSQS